MASGDLFPEDPVHGRDMELAPGARWLRGFVDDARMALVLDAVDVVVAAAPLRNLVTPGGRRMSVAMTGCGALGWTSDARGYRYTGHDPLDGRPWPAMPQVLRDLAVDAAQAAGYLRFDPDACLVNRYAPGTQLTLHQDRDERDMDAPIVSLSAGLPATFLFGGAQRNDKVQRVPLEHGDVVVWGGPSRLFFHGVRPLRDGVHPLVGAQRINLTFRKAG